MASTAASPNFLSPSVLGTSSDERLALIKLLRIFELSRKPKVIQCAAEIRCFLTTGTGLRRG